jgi:hypothetical protein
MSNQVFNSLASQLRPIAQSNEQFMREVGAKARIARDFRYAGQVDREARKWSRVAEPPKKSWSPSFTVTKA